MRLWPPTGEESPMYIIEKHVGVGLGFSSDQVRHSKLSRWPGRPSSKTGGDWGVCRHHLKVQSSPPPEKKYVNRVHMGIL